MRKLLIVISILSAQLSMAQLAIKPIVKSENHSKARPSRQADINPASIPFWDDFSMTSDSPDGIRIWGTDTASQWNYELSKNVYVNATLAINPPSYKVATFDGLDANGAYHAGSDIGLADELVSDTIDLQGRAGVVLSFYWQAGGNVELPEEGDSLRLQFFNPNNDSIPWKTAWAKDGGDLELDQDSVFTQEAIDVTSEFLTQKFVFRFQSYGDKDGPFDAWHVDYIFLDDNRESDNFYYNDISINQQPHSLFSPFTSIPANQLLNNTDKYKGSVAINATALEEPDLSGVGVPAEYVLEINELITSTQIDSIDFGDQALIPINQNPFSNTSSLRVENSNYDLSSLPLAIDSLIIETKVYFLDNIDSLFESNIDQFNDTIRTQNLVHNYYAFDDGTAEYAAGTNIAGGQVAVQFWLEESDTLSHIDIYFPNIDPVSAGSPIELRIFKDLDDEPLKRQDILVINGEAINEFTRYELNTPIVLSDTFYIGYQQSKNDYIGIGFDRSNPAASDYIFENKRGIWEQNVRLSGALMIRPVFAKVDSLILGTEKKNFSFKAYPNPTKGLISIEGDYKSLTVFDFSGRQLLREDSQRIHDFSKLKAGLYLLTIHRKEGDQTLKIIKK